MKATWSKVVDSFLIDDQPRSMALRILQVISTADPRSGGPIEGILQSATYLLRNGHQVDVVSGDDPNAEFIQKFPLPLYALGPSITPFAYAPKMGKWLEENYDKYDAVIGNGIWQYSNLALRTAAKKAKKPYWLFTHGMLDPWFNDAYPLKKLKKMLYWPFQYRVLRDAEQILFTCEEEKLLARKSFRPYQVRERVVTYGISGPPPGSDAQIAAFDDAFPDLAHARYMLFLSRIHPKKGCDLLIKAFAEQSKTDPDLKLVFAGPAPEKYKKELESIASGLNIEDKISWIGMVQGDVKWGCLRKAEAFVLPSHQENFGIAVVEALACGCPVLISKSVNIWREITEDGAGVAETDDIAGTNRLLKTWIELPKDKRAEMSRKAIDSFAHHFSSEKAAESLIEALCERS